MRLLIDNALSPRLALLLQELNHDALHIRDRIPPNSSDEVVFELAASEDRVLISADSDFGTILALRQATAPSVILMRHDAPADPNAQAPLIYNILRTVASELRDGCAISVGRNRIRLRMLPFG